MIDECTIDCAPLKKVNHFDVRMWDGTVRVAVNGVLLPEGFAAQWNPKWKSARVGLAGNGFDGNSAVRYRNVRLRLLTSKAQLDASPSK